MTLESLNLTVFGWLNASSSASATTVQTAILLANDLIYLLPIFLLVYWARGGRGHKETALKAVVVTLVALGLAQVIGHLWPHPRPFVMGVGRTLIAHAPDPSFPSDHMLLFCAVAFTFGLTGHTTIARLIFGSSLAVAWARIYLGVHFPLDMVGSIVLALFTALALTPLWRLVGPALTRFFERPYRWVFNPAIRTGWMR